MAKKKLVTMQASKMKISLAKLMKQYHFIEDFKIDDESGNKQNLKITLAYPNGKPALTKIRRISKAGRRIYRDTNNLPYVLSGLGIAIISNSKGIMTADEAKKQGLGGEVVGEIY